MPKGFKYGSKNIGLGCFFFFFLKMTVAIREDRIEKGQSWSEFNEEVTE